MNINLMILAFVVFGSCGVIIVEALHRNRELRARVACAEALLEAHRAADRQRMRTIDSAIDGAVNANQS